MMRSALITLGVAAAFVLPGAAAASDSEAEMMMRLSAECHYVVRIAEGNGVRLKNSSAVWDQVKATVAEQTRMSTQRYDAEARAKWERRERNLGARDTMRRIADRARECDAQL